jgi:hypothetical protein
MMLLLLLFSLLNLLTNLNSNKENHIMKEGNFEFIFSYFPFLSLLLLLFLMLMRGTRNMRIIMQAL